MAGTRALAELCGIGQTTVVEALRELQFSGVVERTERGIGTRPSHWRWTLTACAPLVDNPTQRTLSGAQAQAVRSAKPSQRTLPGALANALGSNYQDQEFTQGVSRSAELGPRDVVPPSMVGEHMAAVRSQHRASLARGLVAEDDPTTAKPPGPEWHIPDNPTAEDWAAWNAGA